MTRLKLVLVLVLAIVSVFGCAKHEVPNRAGGTLQGSSPEENQEFRKLGAEFEADAKDSIQLMDMVVSRKMWHSMAKTDVDQLKEHSTKLKALSKKYSATKLGDVTTPLCEAASSSLDFAATLTSMRQSEQANPGSVGEITLRQITDATEQQAQVADRYYALAIACKTMGDKR